MDLDPTKGREQAGSRPALVISVDPFNHGPAELVVVLPITSRHQGIPFHVRLTPPEGGVTRESFIKCEECPFRFDRAVCSTMGPRFTGDAGGS